MRRAATLSLVLLLALPVLARAGTVVEIQLDEIIHSVSAEYVITGIDHAEEINADAVLIWMSTPGGWYVWMREIVDRISTSRVPVIVYVAPTGAHATSAGFFILLAADVAVMAPGTTAGAASPVTPGGEMPETLKKKAFSDAAAYLRSFVSKRGRNPELAEQAITEAKSFTDEEALDGNLIDIIADSRQQLVDKLEGLTIKRLDGKEETLALAEARTESWEMTQRQRFLSRIIDPNIAFLLFIFGALGIYIEIGHPGFIVPGVLGGICLVLAMFAFHVLPVNYAAVLLIVLALAFFILEAMYTSHGVLATGGVVSLVLGAMFLVESPPIPQLRVSTALAIGVALPFALVTVVLMRAALKSFGWRIESGQQGLVGKVGEVRQEIGGETKGMIFVSGELWRAIAKQKIEVGRQVRVVAMDGLLLKVEPVETDSPTGARPAKE
ncbi:MAG: nodulation protein NfeD [Terriglobia bacterium]